MYTSLTGAKTGWSLFHLSNRPNWELRNSRTFWHAMDMKFQRFLKEYRELRIHCNERSHLGFCPGATHGLSMLSAICYLLSAVQPYLDVDYN